ncbi:MAG: FAD-dependent oxidoreductase [Candidatus Omnitrophica bacterium]|nr:FAD-dependent oxidoreductase [Candidatus Omnitrophota bacterium]
MKSIFSNQIYDIVVIGGGCSSIGVILPLLKNNKKILIIERRSNLGWEITSAFYTKLNKNLKSDKFILKELAKIGGIRNGITNPFIFEVFLEKFLSKKKVDILYYSYPVDIIERNNFIEGLVIGNKNGLEVIRGKIFVDLTDEALLLKKINPNIEKRSNTHFYSIYFNGSNKELKEEILIDHQINNNLKLLSLFPGFKNNEICLSFKTNGLSLTQVRIRIPEIINLIRKNYKFLEDAIVTHISFEPYYHDLFSLKNSFINLKNVFYLNYELFEKKNKFIEEFLGPSEKLELGILVGEYIEKQKELFKRKLEKIECENYFLTPEKEYVYDVVIGGGGTAGAIAGIACGRNKVKTSIIENSTCLGGIGTGGGIHYYYYGISSGLQKEVETKVNELTNILKGKFDILGFHPEAKKIILEDLNEKVQTEIFYGSSIIDVEVYNKKVVSVICATPEGIVRLKGKIFIDATGDGDICSKSGEFFFFGREKDNLCQPYSIVPVCFDEKNGKLIHINFDAGYVDPLDVRDLTRAKRNGLKHFFQNYYQVEKVPLYISPIIGIRQSRQILGKYLLTLKDEIFGSQFPDVIGYMRAHYDNHLLEDTENQTLEAIFWRWITNNQQTIMECEIPYRCLLTQNIENVIITGRAISLEPEAHYALRMQRDIERLGEVAGLAASLCIKHNKNPKDIDIKILQENLKNSGCLIENFIPQKSVDFGLSFEELKKEFLSGNFKNSVIIWSFFYCKKAIKFLKEVLKTSNDSNLKFWSAIVLAMNKEKDAVNILLEYLKNMKKYDRKIFISVIILLGNVGNKKVLPLLYKILMNKKILDPDILIATIQTIGKIGNEQCVSILEKFLKRKDLPQKRILYKGIPGVINQVEENILWQIELNCLKVLKNFGKNKKEILNKYINDERGYVRNFAKSLLIP